MSEDSLTVVQNKSVVTFVMWTRKEISLRGKLSGIKVTECDFVRENAFRLQKKIRYS